ncbi:hypothetical protein [Streptomyces sp. NBC_00467]|uniref:hypothetical protein n=1 Tax=Streptomyces sp. NBC_00467 TaxID=2975752 RepID=UPI002E177740
MSRGTCRISQAAFARYEPALRQAQPRLGQDVRPFKAVSVLSGRLMLHDPRVRERSDLAYLCTDGSGIWAQPLPTSFDEDDDPGERVRLLAADLLVHRLMSALAFVGTHARDRCATTGTVRIEADVVDRMYPHPYAPPEPILRPGQLRPAHLYPLGLLQHGPYPASEFVCRHAQAEGTALLDDLADSGRGLVEAGSLLADQLFHAFGIAEASPVTPAGEIRRTAWNGPLQAAITDWADKSGVPQASQ